uniref:HSF-type DNA-binding domain-containing protein n=1 Tax=Oryza meridionalis TaxID=40149 RepID=A0A0E0E2T7_9ORYZ
MAAAAGGGGAAPFVWKTYRMVEDPGTDGVIGWGKGNNSFVVADPFVFSQTLLPAHFKHNNFSSFVRQLNTYVSLVTPSSISSSHHTPPLSAIHIMLPWILSGTQLKGFRKVDPDRWEFAHASFLRGQTHLLRNIVRRGSAAASGGGGGGGGGKHRDATADGGGGVGDEDMTMVATEVVRLKQEQRTIDDRVAAMWRRVQETERRPKQMLAFLLKVVGDRDKLHRLVGGGGGNGNGAATAAAAVDSNGFADAARAGCGEKRARLLLDGDNTGAFGPDAVDFAGFYTGADMFPDVAVDATAGSAGCSFAFGVDSGY